MSLSEWFWILSLIDLSIPAIPDIVFQVLRRSLGEKCAMEYCLHNLPTALPILAVAKGSSPLLEGNKKILCSLGVVNIMLYATSPSGITQYFPFLLCSGLIVISLSSKLHIRTHHEHLFLSIVNTDSYRT